MTKRTLLLTMSVVAAISLSAVEPQVVDVHSHFTTGGYLELLKRHDALMDELYPIPAWSPEALDKFLDDAGIGLAVLTSVTQIGRAHV